MAHIVNLQTKPDRLRKGQDEALREALLPFEDQVPGSILRELLTVIDRRSAARNKWTFVMLSPTQNLAVVRFIRQHSYLPLVASELWALCFDHLRTDTGEIMLTREELAEKLGTSAEHVSRIMSELVEFGAISRRRQRVAGLRGPGLVQYFMNPRVATHLGGAERDKAQEDAPLLRLIQTAS